MYLFKLGFSCSSDKNREVEMLDHTGVLSFFLFSGSISNFLKKLCIVFCSTHTLFFNIDIQRCEFAPWHFFSGIPEISVTCVFNLISFHCS